MKNGKCNALVTAIVGVVFSGCAAKAVNTTEWGDLKADPVADEISRKVRKILDLQVSPKGLAEGRRRASCASPVPNSICAGRLCS